MSPRPYLQYRGPFIEAFLVQARPASGMGCKMGWPLAVSPQVGQELVQYPRELRERAVRLVAEHRGQYETEYAPIRSAGPRALAGGRRTDTISGITPRLQPRQIR